MPEIQVGDGTVGGGEFAIAQDVDASLDTLAACEILSINAAGVYPAPAHGASERLLGAAKASDRHFIMNTKIMVTGDGPGQGSLRRKAIDESIQEGLATLGVSNVMFTELLLHIP